MSQTFETTRLHVNVPQLTSPRLTISFMSQAVVSQDWKSIKAQALKSSYPRPSNLMVLDFKDILSSDTKSRACRLVSQGPCLLTGQYNLFVLEVRPQDTQITLGQLGSVWLFLYFVQATQDDFVLALSPPGFKPQVAQSDFVLVPKLSCLGPPSVTIFSRESLLRAKTAIMIGSRSLFWQIFVL